MTYPRARLDWWARTFTGCVCRTVYRQAAHRLIHRREPNPAYKAEGATA